MEIRENIFWQWIYWHFFDVPRNILNAWKNFLNFGFFYFSISLLLKTLFAPWRRYVWVYPRGFDIGKYVEVAFSNLISRVLGAIMRIILILLGLLVEALIIFLGVIVFFGWLVLPLLLISGLYHGFRILI